jgi:hypothetical protein
MSMLGKSVSNMSVGTPKGRSREQLFATDAKDQADNISATNEQKAFVGKGGKPKGPFGLQGKEF